MELKLLPKSFNHQCHLRLILPSPSSTFYFFFKDITDVSVANFRLVLFYVSLWGRAFQFLNQVQERTNESLGSFTNTRRLY